MNKDQYKHYKYLLKQLREDHTEVVDDMLQGALEAIVYQRIVNCRDMTITLQIPPPNYLTPSTYLH